MKLTVLGSGTCAVTKRRSCSSYFIRTRQLNIILDIGFGALRRMTEADLDYRDIDVIVVSHFHLDHIADLAPLLMALRYTPGYVREKPLTIIGPTNTEKFLSDCRDLYGDWLVPRDEYPLHIYQLDSEQVVLMDCLITARPAFHSKNSNGYRIESDDSSLMYSGDSGPCDSLIKLAADVDLALIECAFPDDEPLEKHMTPKQAAEIAAKAGAKKLLLTHFYPQMDNINVIAACKSIYRNPISIAEDLACYNVGS
jgi:ribonuclease BN (tRNA processing enzyme)